MSREIKFRSWDFVNKIMDEDIFIDGAGNAYDYASTTYNTPNTEIQRCDFPVMQFTGLKDKNGVEIYEGDIVTYVSVYKWNKKLQKSVVTFSNGMFNPGSVIGWGKDGTREVIGNIYENPKNIGGI